nr:MAG TPA: hypothetical protein [Caudoviricetes sp.]
MYSKKACLISCLSSNPTKMINYFSRCKAKQK